MKMNLSAVPRLTPVDVIAGDGKGQDERAWARSINALRVRFETLSYRELCTLLRQSHIGDLCCLVISTPYSQAMLQKLREGLSEAVWEMLEKDCAKCGDSLLAADLAAGVAKRMSVLLDETLGRRSTLAQHDRLRALLQQMSLLDDANFSRIIAPLCGEMLSGLICLSGGMQGAFAQRVQAKYEKDLQTLLDYEALDVSQLLSRETAERAITGMADLVDGKPWPHPDSNLSPEETDAFFDEMLKMLSDVEEQ